MKRRHTLLAVIFAAALLAACGADDPAVTPPTATPTTGTATASAPATATASPQGVAVAVTVSDGEVVGGAPRVTVEAGQTVTLTVVSDVADHVHVHGYDLTADVEAGGTATLTFVADLPGVWEVELEESGVHLLDLVVRA